VLSMTTISAAGDVTENGVAWVLVCVKRERSKAGGLPAAMQRQEQGGLLPVAGSQHATHHTEHKNTAARLLI
jgi:hypothetical protein